MSSEASTPSAPRPSVFISYASEDRAAARTLREVLANAGLEVWYDEQELTGGDAWDQKIRRQIRDCEYFMPVISATTEARREGYFRREWRLACERSLDMADDVLFIVPVVIDDTSDTAARVPDKFLTVQWVRAPGGNATPALHHLIRRLMAGDHHIPPRQPSVTRAPFQRTQPPMMVPPGAEPPPLNPSSPPPPHSDAPPPMPPFPTVPEKGGFFHGIKFIAEVLWWGVTVTWLVFTRMPRWVRVLVTLWIVVTLFSYRCSRNNDDNVVRSHKVQNDEVKAETEQAIKAAIDELAREAREARKSGNASDLARIGTDIARNLGPGFAKGAAMSKPLVLAPFARLSSKQPGDDFANAVFAALYGRLSLSHVREVGLLPQTSPSENEATLVTRGKALRSGLVLTGRVTGEPNARVLAVRVLATADGMARWSENFPVGGEEPTVVANKIAEAVIPLLPARKEREKGGPVNVVPLPEKPSLPGQNPSTNTPPPPPATPESPK